MRGTLRARLRPGSARRLGRAGGIVLAAISSAALLTAPSALADPGSLTAPIGVHSMLYLNSPVGFMRSMFAEAATLHASELRLDVAPALIFPTRNGPADFSGLDEVTALSKQYHVPVLADLMTVPDWMAMCPAPDPVTAARCSPADLNAYGAMITQIVAHADPVITDWELWNEPDRTEFYTSTPAKYAWMLRTAHDAIKAVDPADRVLFGGLTSTAAMPWLDAVLATPGADAIHAFDVADVHERGGLDTLAGDIAAWRVHLAAAGFSGPLWVTEHGYPADPAYQWDPSFRTGADAQAAYLTASIPTLLDAGASRVFVTERDNLGGADASEGLLGGDVLDPPVADPTPVERPAYAAVAQMAQCYAQTGAACPTAAPALAPATVALPAVALGYGSDATVTVSDPGPGPLQLSTPSLSPAAPDGFTVSYDACPAILEPDQTCTVGVHFAPQAGGVALAQLTIPSDQGAVSVPVSGVAASVSSLTSPELPLPRFRLAGDGDGLGQPQALLMPVGNPLPAPVRAGAATITGPDAARFRIVDNACRGVVLAPGARCGISVLAVPTRAGLSQATLTLVGQGHPLTVPLVVTAHAVPSIQLVRPARGAAPCASAGTLVVIDRPATLSWRATPAPGRPDPRCSRRAGHARAHASRAVVTTEVADGRTRTQARTSRHDGRRGYATTVRLSPSLAPGVYRVSLTAADVHGSGATRTVLITVGPG